MKITVNYKLSKQAQRDHLLATGQTIPEEQKTEIDLVDLTPAQREILIDAPKDWNGFRMAGSLDTEPTIDQILAHAQEKTEAKAASEAAAKAEAARLAEIKDAYTVAMADFQQQLGEAKTAKEIGRVAYPSGLTDMEKALGVRWNVSAFAIQQERRKEAEKAETEAEKLAWCAKHGSPHLAQAVAEGYNCQRKYATERAAKEFPGYVLDFNNNAEWKDRSCPSPAALAEAVSKDGIVVWLTSAPDNKENRSEWMDDYHDFEPCEAVVIRSYLGSYDLIRQM